MPAQVLEAVVPLVGDAAPKAARWIAAALVAVAFGGALLLAVSACEPEAGMQLVLKNKVSVL